jgi:glycyl-tRNA synthetase beta chain
MRHVQSYFPLADQQGALLPKFVAFRDGGPDHLDGIVTGWENVLRAKLIDATYFYEQDLKTPLAGRLEALRGIVFGERLGTMYEKVERIRAVAAAAAQEAPLEESERRKLDRAALLCKADLTTEVVAELSSLQGVMGREYALAAGEDRDVAEAVGEHYRPRFSGDQIPETKLGRMLALCDKLDTLAALFAVGAAPTGSADPFGLRREAYGVVNILLAAGEDPDPARRFDLSLSRLLGTALSVLRGHVQLDQPDDETIAAVTDFLRERLTISLREAGIRYDLVDAALAVGADRIGAAAKRAHALSLLEPHDWFLPTVIACTRPINIARGFEGGEVDPSLFAEAAERNLWYAYQEVAEQADRVNLLELFGLIADKLRARIDRFFDDVLVMHEDPALRRNRLALCWQLSQLFRRLADFSLIVQT